MKSIRTFVALLSIFALLAAAVAATKPPTRPPAAPHTPPVPPANRIVVVLKDGTSLSGELIEATPAGVTVRPSPKSQPITKPWSAIKQVGNNLTHDSVLAQYRKDHHDQLCVDCDGEGVVECKTCGGKGVDPASAKPCDVCNGTGSTGPCKTPHCADGKIPCPMTCLKAADFHGTPDKDGKRWKKFPLPGGASFSYSDAHLGHLIVLANGQWTDEGVCPRCGGKSVIDDPACHGTGKQPCKTCKGHGVVGDDCKDCDDGKAICKACGGTGMKPAATQPAAAEAAQ